MLVHPYLSSSSQHWALVYLVIHHLSTALYPQQLLVYPIHHPLQHRIPETFDPLAPIIVHLHLHLHPILHYARTQTRSVYHYSRSISPFRSFQSRLQKAFMGVFSSLESPCVYHMIQCLVHVSKVRVIISCLGLSPAHNIEPYSIQNHEKKSIVFPRRCSSALESIPFRRLLATIISLPIFCSVSFFTTTFWAICDSCLYERKVIYVLFRE